MVVVGGVEDRSNGTPEEEVTAAREAEPGTGTVVCQQFGRWGEVCLRIPLLPAGMTVLGTRYPFPPTW